MEKISAYLYDAAGVNEEVRLDEFEVDGIADDQTLWVMITDRNEESLRSVTERLGIRRAPCAAIVDEDRRPTLEKYEHFFRFSVDSISTNEDGSPERYKVDFLVGKNYLITVSDGEPDYFADFRKKEKGEAMIGELDAESIVASLLDQHIVSYFQALNELEKRVDLIEETVLKKELDTSTFLDKMVKLRSDVSKLRHWLVPQREIFISLARPDFKQVAESTAAEHFRMLDDHFESAVAAVEHARDTLVGLFDLYATKSTHMTNMLIQRLTFLTLITGTIAVIAGILGMNFKAEIFEIDNGFWITVAALLIIGAVITVYARVKRWI